MSFLATGIAAKELSAVPDELFIGHDDGTGVRTIGWLGWLLVVVVVGT